MGAFTRSLIRIFYGKITMTLKSKIHKWLIRHLLPLHKTLFGKKTLVLFYGPKKLQNHKNKKKEALSSTCPSLTHVFIGACLLATLFNRGANNVPNNHHMFLVRDPKTPDLHGIHWGFPMVFRLGTSNFLRWWSQRGSRGWMDGSPIPYVGGDLQRSLKF